MFELNDAFLDEVGLGELPRDQRQSFLESVYSTLSDRVGQRLSEGLTDPQLREFADIIDHKALQIDTWLARIAPDYPADPLYGRIRAASGLKDGSVELRAEYAATKWLEVNRPDYRDVVYGVLAEIRAEIGQSRDRILGSG